MPDQKLPSEPKVDEINERLSAGLATCRSMIKNYKSLLTTSQGVEGDVSQGIEIDDSNAAHAPESSPRYTREQT